MTTNNYSSEHLDWLKKMVQTLLKSGVYSKDQINDLAIKLGRYADDPIEMGANLGSILAAETEHHFNLAAEIEDFVVTTEGTFLTTHLYSRLQLTSRQEQKTACQALLRLEKKGKIAKTGVRAGEYRIVTDGFKALLDIDSEDTTPVKLLFPLELERYAKIFQSNIIIVAGEKDTGKTGFCLNFATKNSSSGVKIRYISSEFGASELNDRLSAQDINVNDWLKRVEFGQFQRNDYQDAILPDGINIVDYVETIEGKFYMASDQVKSIYQKLTTGIALIALQKKKDQEYARGGELTAEKARLYVTLSRKKTDFGIKNIATILHCKNRAIKEINPNGLSCEYKLGGGFFFKLATSWMPD